MIQIDYKSELPIYEQIIEQFKLNIMKGVFEKGDPVPSVRKMAASLNITASTVAKAYAELERQGIIETIRAKGTYIASEPAEKSSVDLEKCRKKITSEVIELKHSGYTKDQVKELVGEIYDSI